LAVPIADFVRGAGSARDAASAAVVIRGARLADIVRIAASVAGLAAGERRRSRLGRGGGSFGVNLDRLSVRVRRITSVVDHVLGLVRDRARIVSDDERRAIDLSGRGATARGESKKGNCSNSVHASNLRMGCVFGKSSPVQVGA
jgi:hypothetical protein